MAKTEKIPITEPIWSSAHIATLNTDNLQNTGSITSIRCGRIISIAGQVKPIAGGISGWLKPLATLDSNDVPMVARTVYAYASYNGVHDMIALELLTDGTLRTRNGQGTVNDSWITIPNQIVFG